MQQMILKTAANNMRVAKVTQATDASYPAKVPTVTKPSGDGVVDLVNSGSEAPAKARLSFFGNGADNDSFSCRVIGWTRVAGDGNSAIADLWMPNTLVDVNLTLSTLVGVAGSAILATSRVADTLAIAKEPVRVADVTSAGETVVYSPADNAQPAWCEILLRGAQLLEFIFDLNGTTTGADAIVSLG